MDEKIEVDPLPPLRQGKIIQNKYFCIYVKDKKYPIRVSFLHAPTATYTFDLTRVEWKNLMGFLKETCSDKKVIFSEFDIKDNKYSGKSFDDYEKELILIKAIFADKPKEFKIHKFSMDKTKKYRLDEIVFLEKNGVSANLDRSKFIQFRKFCLRNANKIKIV